MPVLNMIQEPTKQALKRFFRARIGLASLHLRAAAMASQTAPTVRMRPGVSNIAAPYGPLSLDSAYGTAERSEFKPNQRVRDGPTTPLSVIEGPRVRTDGKSLTPEKLWSCGNVGGPAANDVVSLAAAGGPLLRC